ncbi:hypothetical protein V1281_002727 [Nitrobacteraceae bacterium AZCC 2161]
MAAPLRFTNKGTKESSLSSMLRGGKNFIYFWRRADSGIVLCGYKLAGLQVKKRNLSARKSAVLIRCSRLMPPTSSPGQAMAPALPRAAKIRRARRSVRIVLFMFLSQTRELAHAYANADCRS